MPSLANFIPSNVFATTIEETLRKKLVFGALANRKYEGVVRQAGDSVKIPVIGDVTISTHSTGDTLTYDGVDSASTVLTIDQKKRFDFSVDYVDATQAAIDVMRAYTDRASYNLADTSDAYLAALHSQAGITSDLGTTGTPLTITAKPSSGDNISVIELLNRIHVGMDEENVPAAGRNLVVPPWLHGKMVLAELTTTDTQVGVLANGRVGNIHGFEVHVSNNVINAKTTGSKVMAFTSNAMSYVEQLVVAETFTLQSKFGTGARGLHVYGAKITSPAELATATVSEASE